MNILIPMAGEGKRFKDAGYVESKPSILTYNRKNGEFTPMVVCATMDLPYDNEMSTHIIYVDRDFHNTDGTERTIKKYFPCSRFIRINKLTEGQACTCLLAEELINNNEELLIAGCDNGMEYDKGLFLQACQDADVLVFTYRHNSCVLNNPNQYGWMIVDNDGNVENVSIKKAISDNPMEDHAVVSTFWFREGHIFVEAAKKMIDENDRINNEFYVDQAIKHAMDLGYRVKVFEIDKYIGWGTPEDYINYQKTFEYWRDFYSKLLERFS